MEYNCPENTRESNVTYMRTRTGPNYFRVYYKNGAQIRFTPTEVGRVFGIAKFTPTVNSIREWCYQMIDQYGSKEDKQDENYLKYVEKHGFGPECHGHDTESHEEPNDNTKMII